MAGIVLGGYGGSSGGRPVYASGSSYSRPKAQTTAPMLAPSTNQLSAPAGAPAPDINAQYNVERQRILDQQAREAEYSAAARQQSAQISAMARQQRQQLQAQAAMNTPAETTPIPIAPDPEPGAASAAAAPMAAAAPAAAAPQMMAPGAGWEYGQLGGVTPQGLGSSRAGQAPMQTLRSLRRGVY